MQLSIEMHLRRGDFSLNVHAELEAGAVGLAGPSGCGKTTLLHGIAGLVRPDSGRIALDGRVLYDSAAGVAVAPHRRRVGLVFQDSRLFPHLSVRGNLAYGMRRGGRVQRRERLEGIAEMLEIADILRRPPGEISGGQARRVAIARAILAEPELLLLDEPLTGLDERLRREILPLLARLPQATGVPIICVSHHLDELAGIVDLLIHMRAGEIIHRLATPRRRAARNDRGIV